MRVAHFIHRYPPALGGAEAYFAHLGRYLVEQGDQVVVFTSTALDLTAFWDRSATQLAAGTQIDNGVVVHRLRLAHFPVFHRYLFKALSLIPVPRWQAWTLPANPIVPGMWSVRGSFDLVHATAFPYTFPLTCARRLARRLGIPFVLTPFVHIGDQGDPDDRIRRAYTQPALLDIARAADALFVQTEGERRVLLERGIAENRLVLQGMGVDLPGCTGGDRQQARRSWGVGDEVVIGHLANNSIEKGSIDLLRAANLAWTQGARFQIVMAGPEMPNFRAFWRTFRPAGVVRRLGPLDAQQKRDFFAGIDLFVLPSRSDSFGLVLVEAWANGVPCVVYRAGGPPWLVRDGVDGVVVRCGDVEGLADALARLTREYELRRRMGEAGQGRLQEFDWEEKLRLVRQTCEHLVSRG